MEYSTNEIVDDLQQVLSVFAQVESLLWFGTDVPVKVFQVILRLFDQREREIEFNFTLTWSELATSPFRMTEVFVFKHCQLHDFKQVQL